MRFGKAPSKDFHEGYCIENSGTDDPIACDANEFMEEMVRNTSSAQSFKRLKESDIAKAEHLRSGGSETYLVNLLDKKGLSSRGVFKVCKSGSSCVSREFAASLMAHTMGLDVVAVGVFRTIEINGEQFTGYLYELIPGRDLASINDRKKIFEDNRDRHQAIRIFDLLCGNYDRKGNAGNYIHGDDGKLYAIDHGHAFEYDSMNNRYQQGYFDDIEISLELYTAIRELHDNRRKFEKMLAVVETLLGPDTALKFQQRIFHVFKHLYVKDGKGFYKGPPALHYDY